MTRLAETICGYCLKVFEAVGWPPLSASIDMSILQGYVAKECYSQRSVTICLIMSKMVQGKWPLVLFPMALSRKRSTTTANI